jgi:ABC-type antimicrobial peptide transport system permease subunit
MALGASRSHIVAAVTRTALASVLAGTAIGILASLALGSIFAQWTSGNIRSPQMLIAVCALLILSAAAASAGPALAAACVDPIRALRTE